MPRPEQPGQELRRQPCKAQRHGAGHDDQLASFGHQRARKVAGLPGESRQAGQGDLTRGIGEQQGRHQDLAGQVVVTGPGGSQAPPDHEQIGTELGLVGDGDQRQRRTAPQHGAGHGQRARGTLVARRTTPSRTPAAATLQATR